MAAYVKSMITITHTLQINDGRLIPIVIPSREDHDSVVAIVDRILNGEDEETCMSELNSKVDGIYSSYINNQATEIQ